MEAQAIKETKEALVGLLKLTKVLAESFKDGVQAADFAVVMTKIMGDEALKAALLDAYNGIDKVPSELGDLSLAESFDLMAAAGPSVMDVVAALKK